MGGERITKENDQERFKENIVNTMDDSKKKFNEYHEMISLNGNVIHYDTLFYNAYRFNFDENNKY